MEKKYAIGIDIGGQTSKIGLVDRTGNVITRSVIPSNDTTDPAVHIKCLADEIKKIIDANDVEGQVIGVGVGAPNANYYDGTISHAANLTWGKGDPFPFASMLSEKIGGLKVTLTNDANAAAMGEMAYGAAKGLKDFIEITMGTGVGSGIVIDGKVLYGHDGFAGELGHVCAVRDGRQCGCGKKGCLETYCNASGIVLTTKELLASSKEPSSLRSMDSFSPKEVGEAAQKGDVIAKKVFENVGTILGRSLADFVMFSAPEAIVLFGGLTKSHEFFEDAMRKAMDENLLTYWRGKIKILFSTLPASDAAILGASALAW